MNVRSTINKRNEGSPLKNQVMLGAGAPSAVQVMVASLPSNAVRLEGGEIRIGTDAANDDVNVNIKEEVNHWIGSL